MRRRALLLLLLTIVALPSLAQTHTWVFLSASADTSALTAEGLAVHYYSPLLHAASVPLGEHDMERLGRTPWVASLRPVVRYRVQTSLAPLAPQQRRPEAVASEDLFGASFEQLADINAVEPLLAGYNGSGVRMGFIDTAFNFDHPALDHIPADGRLIATTDFTANEPVEDTNQHGTAVASIAVGYDEGNLVGPGWGAEVVTAHSEYAPTETRVEEDNLVAALDFMLANEVDVVNISLGYLDFDDGFAYTYADLDGDTAVTTRAVDAAVAQGLTVVVSAGNAGCGSPESCHFYITTPADADSAITVGAVRPDSTLASFSGRGPTADGRIKPDVVAPGTSVQFAGGERGYGSGGGTSFSAPLTTGVVAMLLQADSTLTPMAIRDILTATASQAATPDNTFGYGIINAELALAAVLEATRLPGEEPLPTISAPFPNPASADVFFTLQGTQPDPVSLRIYDVLGREVAVPLRDRSVTSRQTIRVPVENLSAGVYVYRFITDGAATTGTFVVAR